MTRPDIVARLRAVDHMSVEDCFLQSHLFAVAADEVERLRAALRECAGDLEDELKARYGSPPHPVMEGRFLRDMQTVTMARRLVDEQS
jgi:hypothetical protein